jgi:hypothetical protein
MTDETDEERAARGLGPRVPIWGDLDVPLVSSYPLSEGEKAAMREITGRPEPPPKRRRWWHRLAERLDPLRPK